MKRYQCGYEWAEERLKTDVMLAGIAATWGALRHSTGRCDRARVSDAVCTIYRRMSLPPPIIRWWSSPVAMILAHEVHALGRSGAQAVYGKSVFGVAPELNGWLEAGADRLILGRPVGLRSCGCTNSIGRTLSTACPKHRILIARRISASVLEEAAMLAATVNPAASVGKIETALQSAFALELQTDCRAAEETWLRRPRPVFTQDISMWPAELVDTLLTWRFVSALTGQSFDDSCLSPYIDLAMNVHVGLLRERECWFSDRPITAMFNDKGDLHRERLPALEYSDGTQLFLDRGNLLPAEYVSHPEAMRLDMIDAEGQSPFRRHALIELYGIDRYLTGYEAEMEAVGTSSVLWRLDAGAQGQIRIIEVRHEPGSQFYDGRTFYQLPSHICTLAEALGFVDEPDDEVRLVIDA